MLRLRDTTAEFAAISLSLVPVLWLLRAYELVIVRQTHILPAGAWRALAFGTLTDIGFALWLAAALAIPVLVLAQWRPSVARQAHRTALVVLTIGSVILVQYFAVTFVPLGADLFGYSWSDIHETTMSSAGFGVTTFVAYLCFGAIAWFASGCAGRRPMPGPAVAAFYALTGAALVFPGAFSPRAGSYASDGAFFLAENTGAYFGGRALRRFMPASDAATPGRPLTGYPLLHRAQYDDVLGPRFHIGSQKPNIVIIIVEGLGRDFVGAGAHDGGFTPFLDSLSKRSLYWENFLSTSGRTFGVFPALLGSLPHAEGGFMELGARMPPHITLMTLLHERGYLTSYFTGTDGHFDLIDVFMERQKVDSLTDERKFGAGYEKEQGERGFTWGYGDRELFRRALASYGPATARPRLDVSGDRRDEFRKYSGVFESLLYTDDAIRWFLQEYAKRADYGRTIFVITGDHRLIPVPPLARIDRYRVPFLIFSPMLRAPRRFSSVSSHLDVVPTLLALLHDDYGMSFPDTVPWLGTGIDTAQQFRNVHSLALMRVKNELDEYLDGFHFLSGDQLFTVGDGLTLRPTQDDRALAEVRAKLERSRQVGRFVTGGSHLYPGNVGDAADMRAAAAADSAFAALELTGRSAEALYALARAKALAGQYEPARIITRKLLRDAPNYHDARALLGRTYSWNRQFDEARTILTDLVRRAPEYEEGHSALIDVEIWSGHGEAALAAVNLALTRFPGDAGLLGQKARALDLVRGPRR